VKLLVGYFLFLFLIATSGTLLQDSETMPVDRIIGLLDLPKSSEVVYDRPTKDSSLSGTVRVDRSEGLVLDAVIDMQSPVGVESHRLPTQEIDYEEPAFVVHERIGDWFRVQLPGRTGWLQRPKATDGFEPYPELLTERLAYLREDWDRRFFAEPARAEAVRAVPQEWLKADLRELPVQFLGSQRVENELWLHVRIDAAASCVLEVEKIPAVEGWVPAYQASGKTTAWFHSRGC
jgi:hypothetical protein